jgi:PAS domain S-box-containing protein
VSTGSSNPDRSARLARHAPTAVTIVAEGVVLEHNRAAELLYGLPADEVVGAAFVEVLFDPDDRESMARTLDGLHGEGTQGNWRVRRADGSLLVSSFRIEPLGDDVVAWMATDSVDQGLAEQERAVLLSAEHAARTEAEETSALLEAVLAAAPIGIAVFDLDLRYVRVNEALAAIDGASVDDHLGRTIDELLLLPPEVTADLRRVTTTGRTVLGRTVVAESLAQPGEERHLSFNHYPVRSAAGAIVGAGSTVVDVTQAKRHERERASLLRQAEAAQERLAVLATASSVMTTTLDATELVDRLARVLAPSVGDLCVIELVDGDATSSHIAVAARQRRTEGPLADALAAAAAEPGRPGPLLGFLDDGPARLFDDLGAIEAPAASVLGDEVGRLVAALDLRAAIVAPIEARGRVHGRLALASSTRPLSFDELDLAVEVGHRAALVLENAFAFRQQRTLSEKLQRALLPTIEPIDGLDVAVRYLAATDGAEIGGDWYDVVEVRPGHIDVVIGDVEGHDLDAAVAMGQIRSSLRAYALAVDAPPAAILELVDQLVTTQGLRRSSCVLAAVDVDRGTMRWSNAGHLPPLLATGDHVTLLDERHGGLLGFQRPDRDRRGAEVDLPPGASVVLYTDGVVERRGEDIDRGLARLRAAVAKATAGGAAKPDEVCEQVLTTMLPSPSRADDVAVLVLRRRDRDE